MPEVLHRRYLSIVKVGEKTGGATNQLAFGKNETEGLVEVFTLIELYKLEKYAIIT